MVKPPMLDGRARFDDRCLGVTRPASSAIAIVNGFMVEPGSKVSVRARLRNWAPLRLWRFPGT